MMTLSGIAAVLAAIAALVLLIIYFVKKHQERGRDPLYDKEVYYYCCDQDWQAVAKRFRANIASSAQVHIYSTSGGSDHSCGLAAEGDKIVRLGKTMDDSDAVATKAGECGVWLYGPKPARDTPGVAAFAGPMWFQPG